MQLVTLILFLFQRNVTWLNYYNSSLILEMITCNTSDIPPGLSPYTSTVSATNDMSLAQLQAVLL